MAQESSLGNLMSLIQAFTGNDTKTTTKTGGGTTTSTTKSALTEEDVQKLLQSALEGNSGLAQIAGGQVGSGMYNSTVNTQLTNDLLSRLSTQFAAQNADKTTTTVATPTTTTQTASKEGLGTGGLAAIAGLSLAKNALDPILSGKKSITDAISGIFGGGEDTSAAAEVVAPELFGSLSSGVDSIMSNVGDFTSNLFDFNMTSDLAASVSDLIPTIDLSNSVEVGESGGLFDFGTDDDSSWFDFDW